IRWARLDEHDQGVRVRLRIAREAGYKQNGPEKRKKQPGSRGERSQARHFTHTRSFPESPGDSPPWPTEYSKVSGARSRRPVRRTQLLLLPPRAIRTRPKSGPQFRLVQGSLSAFQRAWHSLLRLPKESVPERSLCFCAAQNYRWR